jgi:peptidoglycan/LPS O-acetylase OafA/YrhL
LLLAAAAALRSEAASKAMLRRFGETLGDASYVLYLSHPFVVNGVRLLWTGPAALFVALAASIGFAIVFHRWIEWPVTQWLNRRAGERTRPLDDVAP